MKTVIIEKNSNKIQKQIEIFEEVKNWALNNPEQSIRIIPLASGDIFASHSGLKFLESLRNYPHQNLKLCITTNGTLITKNKDLVENIKNNIESWSISVDAATAETYQKVRGANWEILQQGLTFIYSISRHISLNFVVQKTNWHEILQFAELSKKFGARTNYTNLLDWGHWTIKWWHDNNVLDRHSDTYHLVLDSLRQVKLKYPQQISFSADIFDNLKK